MAEMEELFYSAISVVIQCGIIFVIHILMRSMLLNCLTIQDKRQTWFTVSGVLFGICLLFIIFNRTPFLLILFSTSSFVHAQWFYRTKQEQRKFFLTICLILLLTCYLFCHPILLILIFGLLTYLHSQLFGKYNLFVFLADVWAKINHQQQQNLELHKPLGQQPTRVITQSSQTTADLDQHSSTVPQFSAANSHHVGPMHWQHGNSSNPPHFQANKDRGLLWSRMNSQPRSLHSTVNNSTIPLPTMRQSSWENGQFSDATSHSFDRMHWQREPLHFQANKDRGLLWSRMNSQPRSLHSTVNNSTIPLPTMRQSSWENGQFSDATSHSFDRMHWQREPLHFQANKDRGLLSSRMNSQPRSLHSSVNHSWIRTPQIQGTSIGKTALKPQGQSISVIISVTQCLSSCPDLVAFMSDYSAKELECSAAESEFVHSLAELLYQLSAEPENSNHKVFSAERFYKAAGMLKSNLVAYTGKNLDQELDASVFLDFIFTTLHKIMNANRQDLDYDAEDLSGDDKFSDPRSDYLKILYQNLSWDSIQNLKERSQQEIDASNCFEDEVHNEATQRLSDLEWFTYKQFNETIVDHLFTGQKLESYLNTKSGQVTVKTQFFKMLSIPVPITRFPGSIFLLKDCIRMFFLTPTEGHIEQKVKCKTSIVYLPKYISIHLKRFLFDPKDNVTTKINTAIRIPLSDLSLNNFVLDTSKSLDGFTFELFALCLHLGDTRKGNYISYSRFQKTWFRMDDLVYKPVDMELQINCEEIKQNACILFYKKSQH